MKIAVTGGAGYIGSHMVKMLLDSSHDVVVIDSLVGGYKQAVDPRADFIQCSLHETEKLSKALKGCDAVMHFASLIEAGASMKEPFLYFENNSYHGMHLLEAIRNAEIKYIIFSSTAAVYGNPVQIPIPEDHPTKPVNFYGQTKLFLENLLEWYEKLFGFKFISLRYFNACGADESSNLGEAHNPETHLIPIVLQAASGKRDHIKIFGADYETDDGTCIRDYIHVIDLCKAHLLALNHLIKTNKSDVFNLGTGRGHSVKEIIEACREVTQKSIEVIEEQRRPGDPPVLVASSEKAKKILGWDPKYTDIKDIIRTAWNWHQSHPNGFG